MKRSNISLDKINKELFLSKVIIDENTNCWNWVAHCHPNGYGQFHIERYPYYAHRVSFVLYKGPLESTDTRVVDHICKNTRCVNPDHLDLITQSENVKRGKNRLVAQMRAASKVHCKYGHAYTVANTWIRIKGSSKYRQCRECWRRYNRNSRKRNLL